MCYVAFSDASEEFSFAFEFHFVGESSLIHMRRQKNALAVCSELACVSLFLLTNELY